MVSPLLASLESAAPAILRENFAPRVGEWLIPLARVKSAFFEKFEQPSFSPHNTEFTKEGLARDVTNLVAGDEFTDFFESLRDSGLVIEVAGSASAGLTSFVPTCRINYARVWALGRDFEVLVCTDSPVVDLDARVFPWVDEGEELFSAVTDNWPDVKPDKVLDLCTGAGTAALLMGRIWPEAKIVGVDNSERALRYARFNAKLNGVNSYETENFDLLKDGNLTDRLPAGSFDIVAVNPPFTPMPDRLHGYNHSSGLRVLTASVKAGMSLVRPGGVLVLIAYGFGSADQELPDSLQALFSSLDLSDFGSPVVKRLKGPVWNLHGKKSNPENPMPVQYMATRFYDPDWHSKFLQADFSFAEYVRWIEDEFVAMKRTHLRYVSVAIKRNV